MDNRHGLVAAPVLTLAGGTAEREAAQAMLETLPHRRMTVGGDKYYDQREFVRYLRQRGAVPQVAQKRRGSALDGRTTRHPTYAVSQRLRKLVEQIFGWAKTVGLLRKTRHRGRERLAWVWTFTLAAYHLVRMRNLLIKAPPERNAGPDMSDRTGTDVSKVCMAPMSQDIRLAAVITKTQIRSIRGKFLSPS